MVSLGDKVKMKSDGLIGIIEDKWTPHLINLKVFSDGTPDGIRVLLKDGCSRVTTVDDVEILLDRRNANVN